MKSTILILLGMFLIITSCDRNQLLSGIGDSSSEISEGVSSDEIDSIVSSVAITGVSSEMSSSVVAGAVSSPSSSVINPDSLSQSSDDLLSSSAVLGAISSSHSTSSAALLSSANATSSSSSTLITYPVFTGIIYDTLPRMPHGTDGTVSVQMGNDLILSFSGAGSLSIGYPTAEAVPFDASLLSVALLEFTVTTTQNVSISLAWGDAPVYDSLGKATWPAGTSGGMSIISLVSFGITQFDGVTSNAVSWNMEYINAHAIPASTPFDFSKMNTFFKVSAKGAGKVTFSNVHYRGASFDPLSSSIKAISSSLMASSAQSSSSAVSSSAVSSSSSVVSSSSLSVSSSSVSSSSSVVSSSSVLSSSSLVSSSSVSSSSSVVSSSSVLSSSSLVSSSSVSSSSSVVSSSSLISSSSSVSSSSSYVWPIFIDTLAMEYGTWVYMGSVMEVFVAGGEISLNNYGSWSGLYTYYNSSGSGGIQQVDASELAVTSLIFDVATTIDLVVKIEWGDKPSTYDGAGLPLWNKGRRGGFAERRISEFGVPRNGSFHTVAWDMSTVNSYLVGTSGQFDFSRMRVFFGLSSNEFGSSTVDNIRYD